MLVSMVFSDEDDEETGETLWFNKREQFKDICFGFLCWDMVQNFGFHTLEDGRVEVYHSGEYFHGNFPPFSLIVRLVFQIHARWLIFATEHHINNYAFTSTTEEEEEIEHRSRSDMPYHLLVDILIPKILTTLGIRRRQPALASDEDEADEIEDLTEEEQVEVKAMIKEKISNNVAKDMAQDKAEIARRVSVDKEYLKSLTTDELIAELSRRKSAPLGRKLTRSPSNGGGAAWEMLKSTNDPAAYMTATAHALQRHQTLRQSEGKKDKLMTRLSQTGTLKRHLTFRAENLPEMKPKIEGLSKIVDPKPAEVKP